MVSKSKLLPEVQAALDDNKIEYEVLDCDPDLADTAAFCEHYNFSLSQAANTIVVASKKVDPPVYVACVNLATSRLDVNKKVRELLNVRRISFADSEMTKNLTGMLIGGVVIFGIKDIPIYIDSAVMEQDKVVMGGGNRHSKVLLDPKELLKIKNLQVIEGLAKPKEE
jgi:prolyl-tRNA editing enzyme YbaK/EbsC (Cys-tRNA(Pro) deacylase)